MGADLFPVIGPRFHTCHAPLVFNLNLYSTPSTETSALYHIARGEEKRSDNTRINAELCSKASPNVSPLCVRVCVSVEIVERYTPIVRRDVREEERELFR